MRFLLKLVSTEDKPVKVEIDYRRRFISLLKKIFKEEYEENKTRPYTFAVYFGKDAKIKGNLIEGVKSINFRFSTGDFMLAVRFYNGVLALKKQRATHRIGGGEFYIEWISQEKEKEPTGTFRTLSPVVVERIGYTSKKERYVVPFEEGFEESLFENIFRRYKDIKGKYLKVSRFAFESINTKEELIKHYGGYVRGFIGKFRIVSDSEELLRFIYQYGLGLRTGQGFGYLEVEDGENNIRD